MYIKNPSKKRIYDMNRFDGICIESSEKKDYLRLFRMEEEAPSSTLRKCHFCIGTYEHQHGLEILDEIEQALANGEKMYVLPETED